MNPFQKPISLVLWGVLTSALLVIPVLVDPYGFDSFRTPKMVLFRAYGLIVGSVLMLSCVWRYSPPSRFLLTLKAEAALPVLVIAWTGVATLFSSHPSRSLGSLVTVSAGAALFYTTFRLASQQGVRAIYFVFPAALVNVVVYFLGQQGWWNPLYARGEKDIIDSATAREYSLAALLGNPNDVGTFLLFPSIAAVALVLTARRKRLLHILVALILLGGLYASRSLGANIAFLAGAVTLVFLKSWKRGVVTGLMLVFLTAVGYSTVPQLKARVNRAAHELLRGDVNGLLSGRMLPFRAAIAMAVDHPLTGVGPGAFASNYLPYKLAVLGDNPRLIAESRLEYIMYGFDNVHSDHLQIVAETGVIGYCIFLGGGVILFRRSVLSRAGADDRSRLARLLGPWITVSFFVVTLVQFPLQLAGPTMVLLYVAAICCAWSRDNV